MEKGFEKTTQTNKNKADSITKGSVSKCRSYNFIGVKLLTLPQQKILKLIDSSELPLTPLEIAQKTEINHNSVKVYLRNLKKRNLVVQPYRGEYTSTKNLVTSDGCIGGKVTEFPRVHNIRLRVVGVGCGGLVGEWDYGVAKVSAVIGNNGVANVFIACSGDGLDYSAFKLVIACVQKELSVPKTAPITVTGYELNIDYAGIYLDGVKALTLRAFDGSFERLYQKHKNILRSEVRAVGPTTPEAVYMLLKGGVNSYNIMQGLAMMINEVRQEREAQKFTNRILMDLLAKLKQGDGLLERAG